MFRKLWMYKTRPALELFAGKGVCWDNNGGAGDGSGGDGGGAAGDGGGGDGGDGGKPTVESLTKTIADMKTADATYKTGVETKVSGLINDLQRERDKNKPKGDDEDDDKDGDKTFLTKKQTMDVVAKAIKDSASGLATAYSEDKLATSVDTAKIKYTQEKGLIPYTEVIEKGFLEFAKKVPGLLEAMKTAQDPAEFAYTIGIAHPVFAARRRATLTKEIVEEMKKPKPTKITGTDGKTEVTLETAADLSADQWAKLPESTRSALLHGTGK